MYLSQSNDYENILLSQPGLLDVRAPIEFNQGAFPGATNLPLLNNEERHRVGICYKQNGQEQAIKLGHKLVSGEIKQQRINQWISYSKKHKQLYLYCFRGGLRSKITQQWLYEAGIEVPRISGGYKALRRFLVHQIETASEQFNFILLGGLTGCRKTHLINQLENGIDLERFANHRGSSFGAHATRGSTQINFENQLAIDFLKMQRRQKRLITLEDEGRFIGSVDIPKNIFTEMRHSPLVVVEAPLQERLEQLLQEYITDMEQEFTLIHNNPDSAFNEFSNYLYNSLLRIRKRLGLNNWKHLEQCMRNALAKHKKTANVTPHIEWLGPLLNKYYDPMYQSQLEKRKDNIVFRGNYDECYEYLTQSALSRLQTHV